MWHLDSIRAKNLCSFLELIFHPKPGAAALIFGNNEDSDSQNSNGSGKSALIEAISIALTGEPLRKVNIDEIINDTQEEAIITAVLSNHTTGVQMTITRMFSRKQPQAIQILYQTGPYDDDVEEIKQASVLDYNKFILDQLGLSKEDIFGNFILTARKYKSFLASSDKDKKELINRFSNGILVDESIEQLRADMGPITEELSQAEKEVASCTGRVEAMAAEIEKAVNDSQQRKEATASRIKNWEDLIVSKRADIRTANQNIAKIDESLDALDTLDADLQEYEKSDVEAPEALEYISDQLGGCDLALTTDFKREMVSIQQTLQQTKEAVETNSAEIQQLCDKLGAAEKLHKQTTTALSSEYEEKDGALSRNTKRIKELADAVREIRKESTKLHDELSEKQHEEAAINNQLAGVIECPKCHHEFSLSAGFNVTIGRQVLERVKGLIKELGEEIAEREEKYNEIVKAGEEARTLESNLTQELYNINRQLREANDAYQQVKDNYRACERRLFAAKDLLAEASSKAANFRKRIFDEAFEVIDEAYKGREAKIKSLENEIELLKGSIASYEKAIQEAREASEEDLLASLKQSREEYQSQLQEAVSKKNEIEGRLNELKTQEATFVEFKTYLANTKINAISQITNEFLEDIGSDIRVSLSGYTILKSGKVRDKISVSLLRDGVDCGSFEKFSAGERVRVELASILAMNKLTNVNCEDGKGLDLLIADEVLDSADEQGLANVFQALNKSQLTSLVISHGQLQESYPNRIIVTKRNGVSFINEEQKGLV